MSNNDDFHSIVVGDDVKVLGDKFNGLYQVKRIVGDLYYLKLKSITGFDGLDGVPYFRHELIPVK